MNTLYPIHVKTYVLCRNEDVSGTSGTGYVAQIAEFDDGTVAVRWSGTMNASGVSSTTVFNSLDDVKTVHGHNGKSVIELVHDDALTRDLENRLQQAQAALREAMNLLSSHGLTLPAQAVADDNGPASYNASSGQAENVPELPGVYHDRR